MNFLGLASSPAPAEIGADDYLVMGSTVSLMRSLMSLMLSLMLSLVLSSMSF